MQKRLAKGKALMVEVQIGKERKLGNGFCIKFYRDLFRLANKHHTKQLYRGYILKPNITESAHLSTFRNILEGHQGCKRKFSPRSTLTHEIWLQYL